MAARTTETKDESLARWWREWRAADFTWAGLAKTDGPAGKLKRWQGWVVIERDGAR